LINDTGGLAGEAADDELLRIARQERLPLVTNEDLTPTGIRQPLRRGSLRHKAVEAGVRACSADELQVEQGADREGLAQRFLERWNEAAPAHVADHKTRFPDDDIDNWMGQMENIYRWLLTSDECAG